MGISSSKVGSCLLRQEEREIRIKYLSTLNKALFGKWCRRFANERRAFWNQVINRKHGEERGRWCSRELIWNKDGRDMEYQHTDLPIREKRIYQGKSDKCSCVSTFDGPC